MERLFFVTSLKFIHHQHFYLSLVTGLTNHRISAQQKALTRCTPYFGDTYLKSTYQTLMTSKHIIPVLFIIALLLYGAWIVYGLVFPRRLYRPGEKLSKIEVVAREKPYFHFTGLDNPHYYVITSQNFTNEFRVSGEVLDLVQDNDSISMAIKEIKFGDTLLLYVAISSVKLLNKGSSKIEIIGLENSMKTLIDPSNIENYYKELKSNNRFSLLVIAIILFFLIKKQIRKKREA